jgi:hypothetical protein
MFKFALRFTTGKQVINLPEKWSEVTFNQYVDLVNGDDKNWLTRLSILSGVEKKFIDQLPIETVELLINRITFINDQSALKNCKSPKKYKGFKYTKLESAWHFDIMDELEKHKGLDLINCAPVVVERCTRKRHGKIKGLLTSNGFSKGIDISQRPVTEVLGTANFFLACLINFSKNTNTSQRKGRMRIGFVGRMLELIGLKRSKTSTS